VEISEIDPGPSWAPQACTLPTAGRPLRAAEFARLLASVQHIERRQPTWLHLDLDPSPRTAGQAAELDRVTRAYPWLVDDAFVRENLERWLR